LEKLERIRTQNRENDWSIGICNQATISDLSKEAIIKARELYAIKNPKLHHNIKLWDDITFLNKANVYGIVSTGKFWEFAKLNQNIFSKEIVAISATENLQKLFNFLNWIIKTAKTSI